MLGPKKSVSDLLFLLVISTGIGHPTPQVPLNGDSMQSLESRT